MSGGAMAGRVPLSDPLALLCIMQNLGLTRRDQASTVEDLSSRSGFSLDRVRSALTSLVADGSVVEVTTDKWTGYYVTAKGILTAMSFFS
ncbi:MAG: hypothetical protein QW057_08725 [Candidatus Bathyarchaeia archaeon]